MASLREAVRCNPDHPMAASALGFVLSMQGKYAEMAEVFRSAGGEPAGPPGAHLRLGEALVSLGQFEEAEGCFEAAVGLAPDSPKQASSASAWSGSTSGTRGVAAGPPPGPPQLHRTGPGRIRCWREPSEPLAGSRRALDSAERRLRLAPEDPQSYRDRGVLLDELRAARTRSPATTRPSVGTRIMPRRI